VINKIAAICLISLPATVFILMSAVTYRKYHMHQQKLERKKALKLINGGKVD